MCNCKYTNGFKQKLAEAKQLTEETGRTHVVYALNVPNNGKHVFMRKLSDLNDSLGICCYYLPNGEEVEYTTPEVKSKFKKAKKVVEIEVVEPETTEEAPTEEA